MDYIIIALWGILAGGLLWGGSGSHSQDKQVKVSQVQPMSDEMIEIPVDGVSRSKVILNQDLQEMKTEIIPATHNTVEQEKVVIVQNPVVEQQSQSSVISYNTNKKKKDTSAKKQSDDTESSTHKAIHFRREKDKSKEKDNAAQNDVQASRDTVIVFRVIADDPVPADQPEQVIVPANQEVVVVEEPVAAPAVPNPSGIRLPGGLRLEQLLCDKDGKPLRHKIRKGESLTQIAQLYYADARFWPYVFEVNRHLFSSPDKVQADMVLYLPNPGYYGIDGDNPNSINKAKALGAKYSK